LFEVYNFRCLGCKNGISRFQVVSFRSYTRSIAEETKAQGAGRKEKQMAVIPHFTLRPAPDAMWP